MTDRQAGGKRLLIVALVACVLLSTTGFAEAARINPDGTVDPDGCGSFATSRADRLLQAAQLLLPQLAIALVMSATAWFARREMKDTTAPQSRQRWGIAAGVATGAAVTSILMLCGSYFWLT